MKKIITILVVLTLVILMSGSLYTVGTREHAVISRFGVIEKIVINEKDYETVKNTIDSDGKYTDVKISTRKGIHFKVPFVSNVEKLENRLITYQTSSRQVNTLDKKILIISNNAQWRIVNPLLFKLTMKTESQASLRLDDILYSEINVEVGKTDAHTMISDKAYLEQLSETVVSDINQELDKYGIEVIDNRILKTDLHESNIQNIHDRMRAERSQKAQQYRSEGEEQKQIIISTSDKEAAIMISEAKKEAETLKGEGDAQAAKIYNEAYSRDADFYEFYQTLELYKKTLEGTTLIIDEKSPLFKYLSQ